MHTTPLRLVLPCAFSAALLAGGLHAATLTWDASGSSAAAPTGGAGTWSSTNLNWSNGVTDVGWTVGTDNAIFASTAGTVALGENITVNNITLGTSYIISGGTGASTLTVNGVVTNGGTATITSKLGGTNGFTKAGAGTLVLQNAAANTYTGNTVIQAGILQARNSGALTSGTTVSIGTGASTATLDVRASQTIAGLTTGGTGLASVTNNNTTGTTRLTIGGTAPDTTFSGTLKDGDATKFLGITKSGANTLTLTGINSFSGSTIVSGGTLKLGSSLTATTSVTVSGGTLSGNNAAGNITLGAGAVSMSSGAISAGGTAAGSFTIANNQSFGTTGGTLNFDLVSSVSFDQIISSGSSTFSLTGTTLALSGLTSVSGTYQLFAGFGGTNSVSGLTITGLADGVTGSLDTTGLLTVTAIPEPSAFAALAGVAMLGFASLRRRR